MYQHTFLLEPGTWLGEGKITFSESDEELSFHTRWEVPAAGSEEIPCVQRVEVVGSNEPMNNRLLVTEVKPDSFTIRLDNDLVSNMVGKGVVDERSVAWEFRGQPNFEGLEVYELQENGDYLMRAEYLAEDHYRTLIKGRIWKKAKSS